MLRRIYSHCPFGRTIIHGVCMCFEHKFKKKALMVSEITLTPLFIVLRVQEKSLIAKVLYLP